MNNYIQTNAKRGYYKGYNAFYKKFGFVESGKKKQLRNDLFEIELMLCSDRD